MTIERAIELLEIEKTCIMRANTCDRNCAACDLVQTDTDLLAAYDAAIEALRNKPEWIECKDKLPKLGEMVLTVDRWGHVKDRQLKRYFDGDLYFSVDGLIPGKDIKYWMPRLKLPKEVN